MTETSKSITAPDVQIETAEKDLYSLQSGSVSQIGEPPPGIDAEVAQFFAEAQSSTRHVVIDDETNRRLRWMVHKRVLTVMVITYFAQTLDKGTINFASIMGIVPDNHLHGQQYAWLTTCVYIAILMWEFPTNRLLQRLPIAKYLAFNVAAWGVVLACTAACSNFTGLVIVRTLLGVFECVCQPAFVFLSTMWYTREEQALVIGSFYSMNGFQQCVGGLVAYGIAHINTAKLKNWQILFTILGCLTFVWGIFVAWYLPDSPMRARCFSPEDRILLTERVRKNDTGIQNKDFKRASDFHAYSSLWLITKVLLVEALKDLTVWAIVLISFTNALPTGGLGAFSNIIITEFGFSQLQTYLLAIAQGAIIMLFLFSAAYLSKKFNQRLLLAFIYTLPNIAGTIVFICVPANSATKVGLLIAFYCTQGFGAVAVLNLAVMSGNIAGRTKQVIASSLCFVAWAVGNAVGPQVFQDTDKPRYIRAFIVHLVVYGVQLATIVFLRLRLLRNNLLKTRGQASEANGDLSDNSAHEHAFDDLTDQENPDFRYVY
ncbi:MFS general substrate transporter [Pleurotus eryngii]|uniref:MFS general substrate transporter n=1 Tax=Pleurotus eryngii TaxID=5323 RepID=A0A9P6A5D8_PLEER|nr:MFS general substrate transporter [Pleurotus eryngii]